MASQLQAHTPAVADGLVRSVVAEMDDDARRAIFRRRRSDGPTVNSVEAQRIADALIYRVMRAVSGYAQLNSVIEQTQKCKAMARRYPWHGTSINKSDHFYFVWFNFSNHCYLFRERMQCFLNDLNKLRRMFGHSPLDVKVQLKAIDKHLGEHIRHRGSHVHEGHNDHRSYYTFTIVEFLALSGEKQDVERVKGFYEDSKFEMALIIERAIECMCRQFILLPDAPDEQLKHYCDRLGQFLRDNGVIHYQAP